MEANTQIDLAKQEVSANRAISSALQNATTEDVAVSPEQPNSTSTSERSARGTIHATNQVRLKRKENSTLSVEADSVTGIPLEDYFGESVNTSELQPADRGFGAWSYVMSAFAMFVVVWGFPQAFPIFQTHLTTGKKARFPDSIAIRLLAPGIQDIEEGILFQFLPTGIRHRRLLVFAG